MAEPSLGGGLVVATPHLPYVDVDPRPLEVPPEPLRGARVRQERLRRGGQLGGGAVREHERNACTQPAPVAHTRMRRQPAV